MIDIFGSIDATFMDKIRSHILILINRVCRINWLDVGFSNIWNTIFGIYTLLWTKTLLHSFMDKKFYIFSHKNKHDSETISNT
jgi:hypothetical protein